ncbi:hypothetical protein ABZP36_000827 [Zizania latifolia]
MDLLGLCLDALLLLAVATGLLWGGAETSIRAYDREVGNAFILSGGSEGIIVDGGNDESC